MHNANVLSGVVIGDDDETIDAAMREVDHGCFFELFGCLVRRTGESDCGEGHGRASRQVVTRP